MRRFGEKSAAMQAQDLDKNSGNIDTTNRTNENCL